MNRHDKPPSLVEALRQNTNIDLCKPVTFLDLKSKNLPNLGDGLVVILGK